MNQKDHKAIAEIIADTPIKTAGEEQVKIKIIFKLADYIENLNESINEKMIMKVYDIISKYSFDTEINQKILNELEELKQRLD